MKNKKYRYEDFLDKTQKKHRYFVIISKDRLDKRILSGADEVRFAGKYLDSPVIIGFSNLELAKKYLAGPRPQTQTKSHHKKDIYARVTKESVKDLYQKAVTDMYANAKGFDKGGESS